MPASTVTVRASGFSATTLSIGFKERKSWVLSAMLLKQWRVPSTFNRLCFFTKSRACSSELAEYRLSVLYSRLPAQFFNLSPDILSPDIQANRGETTGAASITEESLIKVLLFMARVKCWSARVRSNSCDDSGNGRYSTPDLKQVI